MFEVKAINEGDKPNDGDIFQISCSRKELTLIRIALGNQLKERNAYSSMWQKIHKVLSGKWVM